MSKLSEKSLHCLLLWLLPAGIFVLSGQAAAQNAGPAVTVSFIVAAIASGMSSYHHICIQ